MAEAGFGKTMAVEAALDRWPGPAAWVRCTPADRDAAQLLSDLVSAVRRAVPGAADVIDEGLASSTAPLDVELVCRRLLGDLDALLVEPMVMIVDDAEHLASSPGALGLLELLIEGGGLRVRVVVATRRPLELRLAKLRAAGRVVELGPAELAFDTGECTALIELRHGHVPTPAEVDAVMRATEGWPLGVALLALTSSRPEMGGTGSRAEVFRFLAEEVVEQLDPGRRAALIDSSLPMELTQATVDALGLAPGFLADIEGRGLFLRAVDPQRRRFRYHPLFREHLLGRFAAERDPARARALHARAAAALEASGAPGEAIDHWLAAEAFDAALEAMVQDRDALTRGGPDRLRGRLAALPAEVRERPGAQFLEGGMHRAAGRHAEAVGSLSRAVAGFAAADEPHREWSARLALADAAYGAGRLDVVVGAADGFDRARSLAAGSLPPIVAMYASHALADLGRRADSVDVARRALALPEGAHARPFEHQRAVMWEDLPAGRFDSALEHARAAVSELEDSGLAVELSTALAFLAAVLVAAGEGSAALTACDRAQRVAEDSGGAAYMIDEMRWTRAVIHARARRPESAEAELALASSPAASITGRWRVALTHAAVAEHRGEHCAAVAAVERALAGLADAQLIHRLAVPTMVVPILVQAGCQARAAEVLAQTEALLAERFPGSLGRFFLAWLRALWAWLRDTAGDVEGAAADLRAAWALAEGARPQLLRCQWRELRPLIWDGLQQGTLDPAEAVAALEGASPGGEALVAFMDHPLGAVRRLAVRSAAASGRPDALARLSDLESDADPEVAAAARATLRRLRRDPPTLAISVLGGFSLRRGAWTVDEGAFGRPAALRVLRFLVVHRGVLLPEDLLFEAFWRDKPPAAARRNLAVAFSLIRHVLDPPGAARSVIEASERAYRLVLRPGDRVDAAVFEQAAVAGLAARGAGARELLERAERLWTGEPLPGDRYAPWSAAWREELVDRYLEVLGGLARLYGRDGNHPAAARMARKSVRIDPLDERAQRELIIAYARAGRTSHALRQYLECRRQLVDGLGVEPSAETSELQRRILAGEAV